MAALLAAGVVLPGCVGAVRFNTPGDLAAALTAAGATVTETQQVAPPSFGVTGEVWQVEGALVRVYAFPSAAERGRAAQSVGPDGGASAAQPAGDSTPAWVWASGRLIVIYPGTEGGPVLLLSGVLGEPLARPPGAAGEPYPPAVTAAVRALAGQLGIDPGAVEVTAYESAVWPDACLGLGKRGEACAAETTPGWRVSLRADGRAYETRSDALGQTIRIP